MITVLVHMTIKAGRQKEFSDLAARITKSTREEDEGCVVFEYLQQVDKPQEFVLYEQWRDEAALDAHIAHLQAVHGPPPRGGVGLPAAIGEFFEKQDTILYSVIA